MRCRRRARLRLLQPRVVGLALAADQQADLLDAGVGARARAARATPAATAGRCPRGRRRSLARPPRPSLRSRPRPWSAMSEVGARVRAQPPRRAPRARGVARHRLHRAVGDGREHLEVERGEAAEVRRHRQHRRVAAAAAPARVSRRSDASDGQSCCIPASPTTRSTPGRVRRGPASAACAPRS